MSLPQPLVYLAALGARLGDLVVLAPLLSQLAKEKIPTCLIARSSIQEECASLFPGLSGSVRANSFNPASLKENQQFFDFLAHPIIQTYCRDTPRFNEHYAKLGLNGVLTEICKEWKLPSDFSKLGPLPCTTNSDLANTIMLVPGATSGTKRWPKEHWLSLRQKIEDLGLKTAVLGQPNISHAASELIESGITWIETRSLQLVLEVISSARGTISTDTGLMHVSVQQNKPTIALFGNDRFWYRPYSHCFPFFSPPCQPKCLENFLALEAGYQDWSISNSAFDDKGWTGSDYLCCLVSQPAHCMSLISPESVIHCLKENFLRN